MLTASRRPRILQLLLSHEPFPSVFHQRHFAPSLSVTQSHYNHTATDLPPIISIEKATFYRRQPGHYENIENEGATARAPELKNTEQETDTADLQTHHGEHSAPNDNPPLFPGLEFELQAGPAQSKGVAIIGPSNAGKTTFLEILRGRHLCFPPTKRRYPYLSTPAIAEKDPKLRHPSNAIAYVGIIPGERGLSGLGVGTYLSARYESRREITDFSVDDFLRGRTQLNAAQEENAPSDDAVAQVVKNLKLLDLLDMPVSNLSNGQTRRARIARALISQPEVLLLDEPFMGLDPPTTIELSTLLGEMAQKQDLRIVLALRPQDPVPDWIGRVHVLAENLKVTHHGPTKQVRQILDKEVSRLQKKLKAKATPAKKRVQVDKNAAVGTDQKGEGSGAAVLQLASRSYFRLGPQLNAHGSEHIPLDNNQTSLDPPPKRGHEAVAMDGVVIKYGDRTVLGQGKTKRLIVDYIRTKNAASKSANTLRRRWTQIGQTDGLYWRVYAGERWGVFGPNGSGKTTLLALITSDHPQSYSQPLRLFCRSRLSTPAHPALPLSALQQRIGHSSPEVHSFFPKHLTVRATLESAFSHAPLAPPGVLTTQADDRIAAFLRWFQAELNPSAGENPYTFTQENTQGMYKGWGHNLFGYNQKHNNFWYDYYVRQSESIDWADKLRLSDLSFSGQRVLLFLRAIVAVPDLVILDEAFSGLDERTRDKCLLFLQTGERVRLRTPNDVDPRYRHRHILYGGIVGVLRNARGLRDMTFKGLKDKQALISVSHVKEEVPTEVRDWLFLGEDGATVGKVSTRPWDPKGDLALRIDAPLWDSIWSKQPEETPVEEIEELKVEDPVGEVKEQEEEGLEVEAEVEGERSWPQMRRRRKGRFAEVDADNKPTDA